MKQRFFFIFFLWLLSASAPLFAFAQATISPIIPGMGTVSSATPPGQYVASFYTFALMIGGILAFGAVVYGGVLYAISMGNPSSQSEGKEWIKSALIGLLLLGGAYLILFTVNPNLVNLSLPTLSAVDIAASNRGAIPTILPNGQICQTIDSETSCLPATKISTAIAIYQGASTANGPGNGRVACAWAVNNVLTMAGIAPLDSTSVASMENALMSGRGSLVDSSAAAPGDIVIQAQDGHVGICLNNGCTQVISNASGNASFSWISGTDFAPSYSGGPGRIYRINN